MGSHPSPTELDDFVRGKLTSPVRRQEIVRHFLAGCPGCAAALSRLRYKGELPELRERRRAGEGPPARRPAYDYSQAFAAVARTARLFVVDDRPVSQPPEAILAELWRSHDELEPELASLTPERSAIPFLVRWLIEKSHSCRFASPNDMLEWALMARLAAESCSPAIAGSAAKLADLKAGAEAQLANALRVLGRSDEAEAVMGSAWANLAGGSGGRELRASTLLKEADLFIRQRRFASAFDDLHEASALFEELGSRHELVKTEILLAIACHDVGEYDRAVRRLERAQPVLAAMEGEDAYLPFLLRNNMIPNYVKLGDQKRALAALFAARDAAGDWGQQNSLHLRLHWSEGNLLVTLGMPAAAEPALSRVRSGLLRQGMLYEWIVATQDLVRVQHELGRWDAAEQSIVATSAQAQRRRSGPEVALALQQLQSMA